MWHVVVPRSSAEHTEWQILRRPAMTAAASAAGHWNTPHACAERAPVHSQVDSRVGVLAAVASAIPHGCSETGAGVHTAARAARIDRVLPGVARAHQ